jgi:hypothetical protein
MAPVCRPFWIYGMLMNRNLNRHYRSVRL